MFDNDFRFTLKNCQKRRRKFFTKFVGCTVSQQITPSWVIGTRVNTQLIPTLLWSWWYLHLWVWWLICCIKCILNAKSVTKSCKFWKDKCHQMCFGCRDGNDQYLFLVVLTIEDSVLWFQLYSGTLKGWVSFEFPWNPLKRLEIQWNPLKYFKIP